MPDELVLIFVGFALTTVGGGMLGYVLQNRAWARQNEVMLAQAERSAALRVFEDVSKLMDRRLYRMLRLEGVLSDPEPADDELERRLADYREVLFEWNDSLNGNLARVETYFGHTVRVYLERYVYEGFKAAHELLMSQRRESAAESEPSVGGVLQLLSDRIYDLNAAMGELVRGGLVGRHVPEDFTVAEHRLPLRF
jgi:type II secretory pathway component PulJ